VTSMRIFLAGISLVLVGNVHAGLLEWIQKWLGAPPVDYGYWQCNNCYIPGPGSFDPSIGPVDLNTFIKFNNAEMHDSKKETVHRWIPNSIVTICNSDGQCITVYYPADQNLWLPKSPSFPKPPTVSPRVPKIPEVAVNAPTPTTATSSGNVEANPIGLPSLSSQWDVSVPVSSFAPLRVLTPSVTIIQSDGTQTTYRFEPFIASPTPQGQQLELDIGNTLNWGEGASGLGGWQLGDGCHPRGCLYQNRI
jgi:hypothetical protein